MCGIIACFNTAPKSKETTVNKWIIDTYEEQYNRGQEGFGIIGINPDMKLEVTRACEPVKFMFDLHLKEYNMMIAHHRMPTSTENYLDQTHPILVSNKNLEFDYLVVHNGIIHHSDDKKKEHEKLGFKYSTEYFNELNKEKFNDSESLAIELALYLEKKKDNLKEIYGSAAFIVLQIDKKSQKANKLFFGRNEGSPLNMAQSRGILKLSSQGAGNSIETNFMYSCELKDQMKISKKAFVLPRWKETKEYNYGNYSSQLAEKSWIEWDKEKKEEKQAGFKFKEYKEKEDEIANKNDLIYEEIDEEYLDVQALVDNFFELLSNDYTYSETDIDETLMMIKDSLEKATEKALKYHEKTESLSPTE